MTAFFFGNSDRQLYGVYHAAQSGPGRPIGVVLCSPFGAEAIRAHRILRVLAERLARAGAHVLRFDYRGTGDSAGDGSDVDLEQWQGDIASADAELRDMSGVTRVIWIGLRLGASLAMLAARKPPAGLAGLVLWEPVVRGKDYLAELDRMHHAFMINELDETWERIAARNRQRSKGVRTLEALGFEIGAPLEQALEALDLAKVEKLSAKRVFVVGGEQPAVTAELMAHLATLGAESDSIDTAADDAWNSEQAMNAFVVPRITLDAIVARVESWR
ncbi:MAG TPA: alpha/beta fold hydrolase [Rhodanobacteraceae bacterium]|nr:alpha/beta fold hydrolase [Rhodanobacteraceae bacterium]